MIITQFCGSPVLFHESAFGAAAARLSGGDFSGGSLSRAIRGIRRRFLQQREELSWNRVAQPDAFAAGIDLDSGFVGLLRVDEQHLRDLGPPPRYLAHGLLG